ncbi:alpha/beta hydrolase [Brucella sp. NBRC 12950]|jgi:phospholipase/carboxylesterase|uniref:alpha/beta hydrolase n=1 Tax=Brucella sp. NBRC 12950 TaxID=2994518 RepID=UPI0024A4E25D|nr:alpha/beta hydrolase [Brucella sp. NBRC 12950]GLU28219.1 esterase [Brucella sp. NBRC 12950]
MTKNEYISFRRDGVAGSPVIIAFHGTGGNEHQFTGLIDQMLPNAGIVAPRGDVSEFGANRFFRRTGEGIYDMDDLHLRTEKMLGFISEVREQNPDREIYALGYSNGANILASMLFRDPSLFDRAALMHPLIPWTPEPQPELSGKRVLITAGEVDPVSPLKLSKSLIEWFKAQGADVDALIAPGGHEIRPAELESLKSFLCAA